MCVREYSKLGCRGPARSESKMDKIYKKKCALDQNNVQTKEARGLVPPVRTGKREYKNISLKAAKEDEEQEEGAF